MLESSTYREKHHIDDYDPESVTTAVHRRDWARLRELSLRTGGLGDERALAWYVTIREMGAYAQH